MMRTKLICLLALFMISCQQEQKKDQQTVDPLEKIESLYNNYHEDFPTVKEIQAERLKKIIKEDKNAFYLVDIRSEEEQAVSMIPGAMTEEAFVNLKNKSKSRPGYTYCTIGYRSGVFSARLQRKGFEVYNLKGGVLAWAHAGGSFVDSEGEPTKTVHVYSKKYALLPDDYRGVLD